MVMNPSTRSRIIHALSTRPNATTARWLRRAECQIQFAYAFAGALPDIALAESWEARIAEAQALLDHFDTNTGLYGLSATVQEAEALMEPIGKAARKYTIHCVGHGHIDMNWMWSWPETTATTHDTFASVLALMEQFPEVTYSQSQASVYALTEKYHPAQFEQIQRRVREGRWEVAAAHWVEGEKNLASAESLCRHILYTRQYFADKFGLTPEDCPLDWEPDTFGHANTTPTILAQAGVKYYYACRLGRGFDHTAIGDFPRPKLFWWQGPDGSRVLVNRESTWYNSYVNIGENIALPAVEFWKETRLTEWLNVFGIGNHGGGPTRTEIEYLIEMRDWPIYPNVIFNTAKNWFDTVSATFLDHLPVLDHELNFEFTGCYTSQSLIKQANRFGENYCVEAETMAALGKSSGIAGDTSAGVRKSLREAWINVLFNQFHDILPGSGVRQTRDHALGLFQETGAITGSIKRSFGTALAAGIDTLCLLPDTHAAQEERALLTSGGANTPFEAGAGIAAMDSGISISGGGGKRFKPFVIYNPCAWERSEAVTITLYDTDLEPSRIIARDEQGNSHPTLFLGRGNDWGHSKIIIGLFARGIPALGYRTFILCEGTPDVETPAVVAHSETEFETPYLKIKADRIRSGFLEVIDKKSGVNYAWPTDFGVIKPLGSWEYVVERPRGMTAWVLGDEAGIPTPLTATGYHVEGISRNQGTSAVLGNAHALILRQNFEVPFTQSTVRLTTIIHALSPRIDVTAEVDWREIGDAKRGIPGLAIRFPVDIDERSDLARYETPFGSVSRDLHNGEEVPTLRYAHLIGEGSTGDDTEALAGFTLLQDCKYGHSLKGSDLRMRIIRSSFDPDHAPEINKQTVRYSMFFHHEEPSCAELTRLGAGWNHPFMVFPVNLQSGDGSTPSTRSFARIETENVVLSSLKMAEDGDGLILRLAEYQGKDTEAVVVLDPLLTEGLTVAEITDLMERPWNTGTVSFDGSVLRVTVKAHSFVSVRLHG